MRQPSIYSVFLLVLCLLPASVSPSAQPKWVYASSDHFEVFTTAGERPARDALTQFERIHAFFTEYLKFTVTGGRRTRLIIFSNDREYAPYRPNEFATAFYQGGARDTIVMRSPDADGPLVVHEYAHLIVRHSGASLPPWLNEGIAEFYSTVSFAGDNVTIGLVPEGRLRYLVEGAKLMELKRLFEVDRRSPEYTTKAHAGLFYSQSWALTHLLLADARYRTNSPRFMQMISTGTPAAVALQTAFGKSEETVFKDLERYTARVSYSAFRGAYKPPKFDGKWQTRPATAFEGTLVATNVLTSRPERDDDVRKAYEALATLQPDDVQLLESRATFELARGRRTEAQPYVERAVALGTTSTRLIEELADAVAATDPAQELALRERAVSLEPESLDLRLALANLHLNRENSAAALKVLTTNAPVPGESAFYYFQLQARALIGLNRLEEALTASTQLSGAARPGIETEYAEQLKTAVTNRIARRAAPTASAAAAPPSAVVPRAPDEVTPLEERQMAGLQFRTGRIKNVGCDKQLIVDLQTDNGMVRLVIDNPDLIKILGTGTVTVDIQCGAQDRPVRLGFLPIEDAGLKTIGKVRVLDFRPPGL